MEKITFLTIAVTRIVLFFVWSSAQFTGQMTDGWHHIYTGVILMLLSLAVPKKYSKVVLGIGLGLFLDELIHVFHLLGIVEETDYWSATSIITTVVGYCAIFLFSRTLCYLKSQFHIEKKF